LLTHLIVTSSLVNYTECEIFNTCLHRSVLTSPYPKNINMVLVLLNVKLFPRESSVLLTCPSISVYGIKVLQESIKAEHIVF